MLLKLRAAASLRTKDNHLPPSRSLSHDALSRVNVIPGHIFGCRQQVARRCEHCARNSRVLGARDYGLSRLIVCERSEFKFLFSRDDFIVPLMI